MNLINTIWNMPPYLLIAVGWLLRTWINIRRARRRGAGGLQHYRSVLAFLFIPPLEKLVWWMATASLIIGVWRILTRNP